MELIIATQDNDSCIMELLEFCITDLKSRGIYQWNSYYPALNHIRESIKDKSMYILKEDKNCLGTISITEKQPLEYEKVNWLDKTGKILVITKLAVSPARQKQGIGRKLMDFAEDYAVENGYTSIRLDAYSGNSRALNLYEMRGYKKVGEVNFPQRELPFYCYEKLVDHKTRNSV